LTGRDRGHRRADVRDAPLGGDRRGRRHRRGMDTCQTHVSVTLLEPERQRRRLMFEYHSQILADFPTIRAGVLLAEGVDNGPAPPPLADRFAGQQAATLQQLDGVALADLPSITAWRRTFSRFGAKPTQYRNAAEALLRRLTKQ